MIALLSLKKRLCNNPQAHLKKEIWNIHQLYKELKELFVNHDIYIGQLNRNI